MKKSILVVLLGTSLALPLAQAEGVYIGANVGRAELKESVDGIGSAKATETGYKLYAGYQITNNLGFEAGYVDFGKISESYTDGGDSYSYSIKPRAIYLAATGTLPLNEQFSLFAKAGVSFNSTKARATFNGDSGSETENDTTPVFGIGAAYSFTKNLAVVAEYENFGKVVNTDGVSLKVNMLSAGLRYKF